jgi:hypothetical protein
MFKEDPGGRVELDILPYEVTDERHPDRDDEAEVAVPGSLWYRRPYKLHRTIGTDNKTIVCPGSVGRKCPICDHRTHLLEGGADWQEKVVKDLRPSNRDLYVVRPLGSKKFEERPHIWDISQFCFQDKLNDELEENDEWEEFPDLEHGLTLKIRFSEEKIGSNSFAETSRIDFEPRKYKYGDAILREVPNLDEVLDLKDYDEVERLFFESEPGDSADPQAEITRPRAERPATRSRSRDGDESGESPTVVSMPPRRNGREREEPADRRRPDRGRPDPDARDGGDVVTTIASRPSREKAKPTPPSESESAADGECPHGHRFGVDTDAKPECGECKVWDECMDARDER